MLEKYFITVFLLCPNTDTMYSLHRYWILIFSTIICILFTSTSCLRIGNCSTLLGNDLPSTVYDVKIDAEIEWNEAHTVGSVQRMQFFVREYNHAEVNDFIVNVTAMKTVRIQRFIEYNRKGYQDIVHPYCSLSFSYDYNTSLEIPYGLEDGMILHAENCIQKVLCKFNPEHHKIGDDIHVVSRNRQVNWHTTSQATINSMVDLVLNTCQTSLLKGTRLLIIPIPKFEVSAYTITFSSSGGVLDILKYLKRDGDLTFQHEGYRYSVDVALRSTGGFAELNDVSLTSKISNFVKGRLPVNTTDTKIRMKLTLDYNQMPCKISATDVNIDLAPEQYDFTTLKVKAFGFEVTNAEKVLKTLFLKSRTVSSINNKLAGMIATVVEKLKCEDYRDLVFELKKEK